MNRKLCEDFIAAPGRSGWLVRSTDRRLGLGVVGDTREEAEARFEEALERRVILLADDAPASGASSSP